MTADIIPILRVESHTFHEKNGRIMMSTRTVEIVLYSLHIYICPQK